MVNLSDRDSGAYCPKCLANGGKKSLMITWGSIDVVSGESSARYNICMCGYNSPVVNDIFSSAGDCSQSNVKDLSDIFS
jgi:hypothetical protein